MIKKYSESIRVNGMTVRWCFFGDAVRDGGIAGNDGGF